MSALQKILILEDDDLDYQVLIRHMSSHRNPKYEFLRATTIAEAHALIAEHDFAAALVDHSLAGGDSGLDFVSGLGGRESAFPSIILTGMDFSAIEEKIIKTGAYDYIEKLAVTRDLIDRAIQFAISAQGYEKRLKESVKQAETLAKFNHDILSVVSREMQSPLTSMIKCSNIVVEHADKKIVVDAAKTMSFSARQVDGFLQNLSDLIYLDSGAPEDREQEFRPVEILQEAVDAINGDGEHDTPDVMCDFASVQSIALRGDGLRLRNIAVTLLKNASRQSKDRDINVSASFRDGVFSFRVENCDVGLSAEDIAKIRNHEDKWRDAAGAPESSVEIGLSICARLLDQMNGALLLSTEPGEGTTAGFDVPLQVVTDKAA